MILPRFERDHLGEQRLRLAQLLAEQPDELAAAGRRDRCASCRSLQPRARRHIRDRRASPVRSPLPSIGEWLTSRPAWAIPNSSSSCAASSAGLMRATPSPCAIAATPASIVSSFLPKHSRTRCRGGSCSAKADSGTTATPACSTAARGEGLVVGVDAGRLEVDAQEVGRGRVEHGDSRRRAGPRSSGRVSAGSGRASAASQRRPRQARTRPPPAGWARSRRSGTGGRGRRPLASSGAATIQPTFHPVSEKILPAEPTLIVRSAMPGKRRERREAPAVEQRHAPTPRR